MIKRLLDPFFNIHKKSFFLLGPRSIGKTFWVKRTLPKNAVYINLLKSDEYLALSSQPDLLRKLAAGKEVVVIDEIQKLPILLDEVHSLIEETQTHFLLTGSSARKLKKNHANLLGGRAGMLHMYPLCSQEIENFDLNQYLNTGGLPRVFLSEDKDMEFDPYIQLYLQEEIQIESNIRHLQPFSRFLKLAALSNGQLLNYQSIASDVGLSANTISEYYNILQDTLIGFKLDPWLESKKRKAIQTSKFYFFDIGVCNYICDRKNIASKTKEWGDAFEHLIVLELRAWIMYSGSKRKLFFWRNQSKHEVDFILDNDIGIEVKATSLVQKKHLNGLKALQEEKIVHRYIVVSLDPFLRTENGIEFLPWKIFLQKLWSNEFAK